MSALLPFAEVIGDPIAQSKSPIIHRFWLEKLGILAEYRATHVPPEGLAQHFVKRRSDPLWLGCNVTIPHKQAVMRYLGSLMRTAQRVGAVNCVFRTPNGLTGENSDVQGVLESIDAGDFQREAGVACLIGAGGAARAAVHALQTAGASELRIIARDAEKAHSLLGHFEISGTVHDFGDAEEALAGADTVINASPLGMAGQPAMPASLLAALALTAPDSLVFDMVYAPLETALLAAARAADRRAVDGLTMLIGQADLAFQLFFQSPPPREHDAELRGLLTQ